MKRLWEEVYGALALVAVVGYLLALQYGCALTARALGLQGEPACWTPDNGYFFCDTDGP